MSEAELSYCWSYCVFLICSSISQQKGLTGVSRAVQPDAKRSHNRSSYQTSHEVIRKTDSFGREQTSEGSKWGQWYVCVEHFQLSPIPLRWKSLIPSSFLSLDSDIHTLSATRSKLLYSSLPQSSYSALLSIVPYPLYPYMPWPQCYAAGKLRGFSHWNILSQSRQTYSRQIATCKALGIVQSTCVEIDSALWLPLVEHPSTVQIGSYNGW